ncbi:hypothetical protein CHUAL_004834 [Chamberlinius hualienensis]
MADERIWSTKWVPFFLIWSLCFQMVVGYYCEWDQCGSAQYCCGDNLCCEYVYSLWYFWVGILFVVILLSACGGLFRYCYYHSPPIVVHRITSYVRVPNVGSLEEPERYLVGEYEDHVGSRPYSTLKLPGYFPPQGPPPPYSAAVSMHNKSLPKENDEAMYP